MESKSQTRRGLSKKIVFLVIAVIAVTAAGIAGAILKKKPEHMPSPEEAKEIVQDYLEKRAGRGDFKSEIEVTKETMKDNGIWTKMNVKYDAPPDYESVYRGIGEDLTVVEKMFASDEERQWGRAVRIVFGLCQVADDVAVDPWLAARLCDAYLVPNVEKFESKAKYGPDRDSVMRFVANVYRKANESDRLIDLGKSYLAKDPTSKRADVVRWHLARALESKGDRKEAIKYLDQITDPSLTNEAAQRLQILNPKTASKK